MNMPLIPIQMMHQTSKVFSTLHCMLDKQELTEFIRIRKYEFANKTKKKTCTLIIVILLLLLILPKTFNYRTSEKSNLVTHSTSLF